MKEYQTKADSEQFHQTFKKALFRFLALIRANFLLFNDFSPAYFARVFVLNFFFSYFTLPVIIHEFIIFTFRFREIQGNFVGEKKMMANINDVKNENEELPRRRIYV